MTIDEVIEEITESGLNLGAGDFVDVEALKDAVKYLKEYKEMQWISVKNRLPEEGENILIFVNDLKSEPVQADVCYYDGDEAWLDSGYNFGSDVTYWMPLPNPPEGE